MNTISKTIRTALIGSSLALTLAGSAYAQCAGCGSSYNKSDRRATEVQRVINYDKPVRKDVLGNALIGGGVSGIVRGGIGAAASSVATGTATGAAVQKYQDSRKKK